MAAGAIAATNLTFGLSALFLAVAASVICGTALFLFGRKHGDAVLAFMCRISFSPTKCIGLGRTTFDRIGPSALILARFMPGLAALAPALAGSVGMAVPVFLAFQALSALLFTLFGLSLGYAFDSAIQAIVIDLKSYLAPTAVALAVAVVVWLGLVGISLRHR